MNSITTNINPFLSSVKFYPDGKKLLIQVFTNCLGYTGISVFCQFTPGEVGGESHDFSGMFSKQFLTWSTYLVLLIVDKEVQGLHGILFILIVVFCFLLLSTLFQIMKIESIEEYKMYQMVMIISCKSKVISQ